MLCKISPTQLIPLSYELWDGASAPTRYVQAVILRSSDRSVLDTINLTDNGSGDFSDYSVTPTSLSLSENIYFEVVITVYSDSGYTTVDSNRYTTTKQIYFVSTEPAGAILGGREIGGAVKKGIQDGYDDLIEKIFSFNKLHKIKDKKAFGRLVLNIKEDTGENIKTIKNIQEDIKKINILTNEVYDGLVVIQKSLTSVFTESISDIKKAIKELNANGIIEVKKSIKELKNNGINEVKKELVTILGSCDGIEKRISKFEKLNQNLDDFKKLVDTTIGEVEKFETKYEEVNKKINQDHAKIQVDLNLKLRALFDEFETKMLDSKMNAVLDKVL